MVKLTKQYFKQVADIIKENTNDWLRNIEQKNLALQEEQYEKLPIKQLNNNLCNDFSNYFQGMNPEFDKDKFMNACMAGKQNNQLYPTYIS